MGFSSINEFDNAANAHERRVIKMARQFEQDIQSSIGTRAMLREYDERQREIRVIIDAIEENCLHASGVAYVAWADSWRNIKHGFDATAKSHLVLLVDWSDGRIARLAGQTLCSKQRKWGLSMASGEQIPSCPRCANLAKRLRG